MLRCYTLIKYHHVSDWITKRPHMISASVFNESIMGHVNQVVQGPQRYRRAIQLKVAVAQSTTAGASQPSTPGCHLTSVLCCDHFQRGKTCAFFLFMGQRPHLTSRRPRASLNAMVCSLPRSIIMPKKCQKCPKQSEKNIFGDQATVAGRGCNFGKDRH